MRSIKNIFYLAQKELRSLFSDLVLMVLIVFMFTVTVLSAAEIDSGVKNAAVAVVDGDRSALSYRLRDAVREPFFQPPQEVAAEAVNQAMDKGEYIFTLEIPPNFERDVLMGRSPELLLQVDATAMSQAGLGAAYLTRILERETAEFARQQSAEKWLPVKPVIRSHFNANAEGVYYGPPMELGNMVLVLALILVGAAVIREREHGTIEHLLVMPVNAAEIMLAKVLANSAVILLVSMLSMWLVVKGILGVPIYGSIMLYGFGVAVYLFSIAALAVMLATIAPSMAQFGLLMIPLYMVLLLFSGVASPRNNMPAAAQWVSEYWPSTQFIQFAQSVLFRNAGLSIVWPQLLAMALTGLLFLAFALMRFRKMLEQHG
ncbi:MULTISPECIES: ABC transporter permease [unclassified Neisseria]|uniref:ABC-2 transporter permease n=1 Tax=unclassified Neisseria TaxID=2623750 RepID=UPI002665B90C|nr:MULTISPECIES: ABC transporter permease [unclassified Neisseria]MDO1508849.1 ABC transporter permease [Neisseria sp. MVDL19-042950]MDO1515108.1 ABC transporter permease [Neisseria sp. MVDL18-041461]MDO1562468.1 ABC transporter permease [Neisseria sp. MVDL20-010259]